MSNLDAHAREEMYGAGSRAAAPADAAPADAAGAAAAPAEGPAPAKKRGLRALERDRGEVGKTQVFRLKIPELGASGAKGVMGRAYEQAICLFEAYGNGGTFENVEPVLGWFVAHPDAGARAPALERGAPVAPGDHPGFSVPLAQATEDPPAGVLRAGDILYVVEADDRHNTPPLQPGMDAVKIVLRYSGCTYDEVPRTVSMFVQVGNEPLYPPPSEAAIGGGTGHQGPVSNAAGWVSVSFLPSAPVLDRKTSLPAVLAGIPHLGVSLAYSRTVQQRGCAEAMASELAAKAQGTAQPLFRCHAFFETPSISCKAVAAAIGAHINKLTLDPSGVSKLRTKPFERTEGGEVTQYNGITFAYVPSRDGAALFAGHTGVGDYPIETRGVGEARKADRKPVSGSMDFIIPARTPQELGEIFAEAGEAAYDAGLSPLIAARAYAREVWAAATWEEGHASGANLYPGRLEGPALRSLMAWLVLSGSAQEPAAIPSFIRPEPAAAAAAAPAALEDDDWEVQAQAECEANEADEAKTIEQVVAFQRDTIRDMAQGAATKAFRTRPPSSGLSVRFADIPVLYDLLEDWQIYSRLMSDRTQNRLAIRFRVPIAGDAGAAAKNGLITLLKNTVRELTLERGPVTGRNGTVGSAPVFDVEAPPERGGVHQVSIYVDFVPKSGDMSRICGLCHVWHQSLPQGRSTVIYATPLATAPPGNYIKDLKYTDRDPMMVLAWNPAKLERAEKAMLSARCSEAFLHRKNQAALGGRARGPMLSATRAGLVGRDDDEKAEAAAAQIMHDGHADILHGFRDSDIAVVVGHLHSYKEAAGYARILADVAKVRMKKTLEALLALWATKIQENLPAIREARNRGSYSMDIANFKAKLDNYFVSAKHAGLEDCEAQTMLMKYLADEDAGAAHNFCQSLLNAARQRQRKIAFMQRTVAPETMNMAPTLDIDPVNADDVGRRMEEAGVAQAFHAELVQRVKNACKDAGGRALLAGPAPAPDDADAAAAHKKAFEGAVKDALASGDIQVSELLRAKEAEGHYLHTGHKPFRAAGGTVGGGRDWATGGGAGGAGAAPAEEGRVAIRENIAEGRIRPQARQALLKGVGAALHALKQKGDADGASKLAARVLHWVNGARQEIAEVPDQGDLASWRAFSFWVMRHAHPQGSATPRLALDEGRTGARGAASAALLGTVAEAVAAIEGTPVADFAESYGLISVGKMETAALVRSEKHRDADIGGFIKLALGGLGPLVEANARACSAEGGAGLARKMKKVRMLGEYLVEVVGVVPDLKAKAEGGAETLYALAKKQLKEELEARLKAEERQVPEREAKAGSLAIEAGAYEKAAEVAEEAVGRARAAHGAALAAHDKKYEALAATYGAGLTEERAGVEAMVQELGMVGIPPGQGLNEEERADALSELAAVAAQSEKGGAKGVAKSLAALEGDKKGRGWAATLLALGERADVLRALADGKAEGAVADLRQTERKAHLRAAAVLKGAEADKAREVLAKAGKSLRAAMKAPIEWNEGEVRTHQKLLQKMARPVRDAAAEGDFKAGLESLVKDGTIETMAAFAGEETLTPKLMAEGVKGLAALAAKWGLVSPAWEAERNAAFWKGVFAKASKRKDEVAALNADYGDVGLAKVVAASILERIKQATASTGAARRATSGAAGAAIAEAPEMCALMEEVGEARARLRDLESEAKRALLASRIREMNAKKALKDVGAAMARARETKGALDLYDQNMGESGNYTLIIMARMLNKGCPIDLEASARKIREEWGRELATMIYRAMCAVHQYYGQEATMAPGPGPDTTDGTDTDEGGSEHTGSATQSAASAKEAGGGGGGPPPVSGGFRLIDPDLYRVPASDLDLTEVTMEDLTALYGDEAELAPLLEE
jgi:hypothetical protein